MTEAENQIRGAHEVALSRLEQTRATIQAMHDQERVIILQIRDCEAAARLFGFEFPKLDRPTKALLKAPENVREFTLALLHQSPNGIKSAAIREAYESQFRKQIHPKTIGMTLYRLKQDGLAEINGHIWCPVFRIGEYRADYSVLTEAEIAAAQPSDVDELFRNSISVNRRV